MGGNHPHPGRFSGRVGNLGDCWIADMAGARIMSPVDHPVHHSGCVRMKLNPLPEAFPQLAKKEGQFCMSWNFLRLSSPFSFEKISDFGQQFFFTRRPCGSRRLLEAIHLFITIKRQKAMIRNSITVLMNKP